LQPGQEVTPHEAPADLVSYHRESQKESQKGGR
jgi:hypothetical protein